METEKRHARKGELCPIPWPGVERIEARAYHAEDLEQVRFHFLRTARNPKVCLGGVRHIRRLNYAFSSKDGGAKGTCTVHRISKDADAIREFYERLGTGLKYEGEGVPPRNREGNFISSAPRQGTAATRVQGSVVR